MIRFLPIRPTISNLFGLRQPFATYTESDLKKAEEYVRDTLRSRSPIDYIISSYYPASVRNAFCAIQLFNLEMTKISDNVRQPSLALGKLQFWRNTINKIYKSQVISSEPISICLDHACHNHPLTKGYFDRIINVKAEQISTRNIETMDQMLHLCQNNISTLIALNLELLHIEIEQEYEALITKMGHSIGICFYLKRVPFGLRNYRYFVPLDIMNKHNVQPTKIWDRVHGKPSEDFFDAVLEVAAYAKKQFEQSVIVYEGLVKQKKMNPQTFRAFLRAVQIQQYLKDLQKFNFNLFEPEVVKGSPITLPFKIFRAAKNKQFYLSGKID